MLCSIRCASRGWCIRIHEVCATRRLSARRFTRTQRCPTLSRSSIMPRHTAQSRSDAYNPPSGVSFCILTLCAPRSPLIAHRQLLRPPVAPRGYTMPPRKKLMLVNGEDFVTRPTSESSRTRPLSNVSGSLIEHTICETDCHHPVVTDINY